MLYYKHSKVVYVTAKPCCRHAKPGETLMFHVKRYQNYGV